MDFYESWRELNPSFVCFYHMLSLRLTQNIVTLFSAAVLPIAAASQVQATEWVCNQPLDSGTISRYSPTSENGGGWKMAACKWDAQLKKSVCETYSTTEPTAAHRTLTFGTRVKVDMENGKSVIVRINDRGPYIESRILDLNEVAARGVGLTTGIGLMQGSLYECHEGRVP